MGVGTARQEAQTEAMGKASLGPSLRKASAS